MVVVPTSRHVTLYYGETPVDLTGWILTYLGVIGVVVLSRRRVLEPDFVADRALTFDEEVELELARLSAELEPEAAEPVH
jgi:hypothetical protein